MITPCLVGSHHVTGTCYLLSQQKTKKLIFWTKEISSYIVLKKFSNNEPRKFLIRAESHNYGTFICLVKAEALKSLSFLQRILSILY